MTGGRDSAVPGNAVPSNAEVRSVATDATGPWPRDLAQLRGRDPYDALAGTRVPGWVRATARGRQIAIQLRKRSPVDVGGLLGVEPFVMAKTVGCALSAAARHGDAATIPALTDALEATGGSLGDGSYGYEFDVQTRWAFYPAGSPNLIATVFAARGLAAAGVASGAPPLVAGAVRAAGFVQGSLHAAEPRPYYRYTLTSDRLVHNANLLGAGLVAMMAALGGEDGSRATALSAARAAALTSMDAQRDDGSWPYGKDAFLGWSDNFHTAYNLDGLLQVWLATGDERVRACLDRGVLHWQADFFGPDGAPKYYPHKALPYDIHSAGTAIDVAARLSTWGWDTGALAGRVAEWTRRHLVDPATGATYFQKRRLFTDRRHFVRWGDAHLGLGHASLALVREGRRDPLEAAVARASGVMSDAE